MEDALIQLDQRLAGVERILQPMGQDVASLKSDLGELRSDVGQLKSDVGELKSHVSHLGIEVSGIQRDLANLTHVVERNHGEVRDCFAHLAARFDQLATRLEGRGVI